MFYFAPQKTWYLVHQTGNASYSTNTDISDPNGWSVPRNFYSSMPDIIRQNIGNGYWVDMWVICDNQYLLIVEAIGSDGRRYFRSWTSGSIAGSWTLLPASESNPFARVGNTAFPSGAWTKDISHGELIRAGYDPTLNRPLLQTPVPVPGQGSGRRRRLQRPAMASQPAHPDQLHLLTRR